MNCDKKIPDMLILVIYLLPAMLFFIFQKKIQGMLILVLYVFTPSYAIVNCVKKF